MRLLRRHRRQEFPVELCDDCGLRPAVVTTGTPMLFLCAGCAWGPGDDHDEVDL